MLSHPNALPDVAFQSLKYTKLINGNGFSYALSRVPDISYDPNKPYSEKNWIKWIATCP